MSAVEEIQSAIANLTEMRAGASPGTWVVTHSEEGTGIEWAAPNNDACNYVAVLSDINGEDFNADPGGGDCDAYLIVALYRTIDAQLAILNGSLIFARTDALFNDAPALPLARAINGTA